MHKERGNTIYPFPLSVSDSLTSLRDLFVLSLSLFYLLPRNIHEIPYINLYSIENTPDTLWTRFIVARFAS